MPALREQIPAALPVAAAVAVSYAVLMRRERALQLAASDQAASATAEG